MGLKNDVSTEFAWICRLKILHGVAVSGGHEFNNELPKPKLPNVNLLLGDNGSGKINLLSAIGLAGSGPAWKEWS